VKRPLKIHNVPREEAQRVAEDVQAAGLEDIQVVHRMQDHFRLVPLTPNAEKNAVAGKVISSWSLNMHPGRFEADYISRAVAARTGVALALAEDMVCFQTAVDYTGEPLKGANQYVIHFSRERIPPVNAFWSPKDSFNLVVRMYWLKPDVFSGRWRPPAVTRMK